MSQTPSQDDALAASSGPPGMDETAWLDVIHKMDEVYNDLLQYEVALEEKNAALEDSRNFIFSVLSSMSDLLIVTDRSGTIQEVNPPLERLTGAAESDLKGLSLMQLFADETSRQKATQMFVRHGDQGGAAHDCELQLKAADGSLVPVSFNCTPRVNTIGKTQGFVVTGRPVGELRRAYQALGEAHEELKRAQRQLIQSEKMASLGRLVAGVAHELNNPISFVLGNVHALQKYAERLRRYIEAFHAGQATAGLRQELRVDRILDDLPSLIDGTVEGAERTRDIVDGLKRFSALDLSEGAEINLAEVLDRAVLWVTKAAPASFTVTKHWADTLPVEGSAGQLQQVLMNLVQNARDATADRDEGRLSITSSSSQDQIVLEFHDNGPGIAAADLPHLFDPFFTTKPVGQGTGLGLAISYTIVERHGGKLTAANHPEGGAVFSLSLPRAKTS